MRRMHKEGECAASECSLVCNDFLRAGFSDFVVDPGVRQVSHTPSAALCARIAASSTSSGVELAV